MSPTDPDDRRRSMVQQQLIQRGIRDQRVLQAIERVPRHRFVPHAFEALAYEDQPVPIGFGQTMSQPYIVALMLELAQIRPAARVLDVGTGCGYQAAVLAEMGAEVYSVEIVPQLAESARQRLDTLDYSLVRSHLADGSLGWPEHAPYDAIVAAAAPDHVPQPLIDQLAPGGRLVLPVGRARQHLAVLEKGTDGRTERQVVAPVTFVPMTGAGQRQRR